MKRPRLHAALALSFITCACSARNQPVSSELVIRARLDDGRAAPLVAITVNDASLGTTDLAGELRGRLTGAEGATFALEAVCPPPLLTPTAPLPRLVLSRFRSLTEDGAQLVVDVRCERPDRTVAVVVRAVATARPPLPARKQARGRSRRKAALLAVRPPKPLGGVPVLFQGKEVGRTDAHGLSHLSFTAAPNQKVELTLNTSAPHLALLRPRNPSLVLDVRGKDDIHLFEQTFAEERPAAKPRRARRPRAERSRKIRILQGSADPLLELGATRAPRARR